MDVKQALKDALAVFPAKSGRNLRYNFSRVRAFPALRRMPFVSRVISESLIESSLYYWCELVREIVAVQAQPFQVTLVVGGKKRRYTPDALILSRRHKFVVECKPIRDYFLPGFQELVMAAQAHFPRYGFEFVVIDEVDVCSWGLQKNLVQLWRVVEDDDLCSGALAVQDIVLAACADQPPSFGPTVDECLARGVSMPEIHRALVEELVFANLHREIDGRTKLLARWPNVSGQILEKLRGDPPVQRAQAPSVWTLAPRLPGIIGVPGRDAGAAS